MHKRPCVLAGLCLALLSATTGCYWTNGKWSFTRPSKPPLNQVLHISVRSSLLSPGTAVLQVTNVSAKPVGKLTFYFRNRDNNQQASYQITEIKPSEGREIGVLQVGWALEPNEEITVVAEGFTGFRLETYWADNGTVGIRTPWW